jgi:HlyD family secretion protein
VLPPSDDDAMKWLGPLLVILIGAVTVFSLRIPPPLSPMFGSLLSVTSSFSAASIDAPAYRTAAVERGDIIATVQAAGTLNALVTVDVGSQISGQVKELYADFNSSVSQGQVIARVEPEIYEAKLAQSQAELEMAETMVSVQRAQIERDRAGAENARAAQESAKAQTTRAGLALDDATQDRERKRPLAQQNIVTAADWERIQNAHRSAQAQVTASRALELSQAAAIGAAEAALKMADAQLTNTLAQVKQKQAVLRQAQIDVDRTYIRAPVTGTVVNRAVSGGQTVAASLQTPTLFTIAQDLTQMQVEASVVEADVSRFEIGQPVTFTVDAHPGRLFSGNVKQIRKAPQIVQNIVTYVVVITTKNPDEVLLPGMTANLQVVVAKREGVLKVPNTALRFHPAGQVAKNEQKLATRAETAETSADGPGVSGRVFVLNPKGQPTLVQLQLGITDGRVTEVLSGDLKEGQPVIIGSAAPEGSAPDATSSLLKFRLR